MLRYKNKVKIILFVVDENIYFILLNDNINKWWEKVGEGFFLFVGVLWYYKGLDFLFEVVKIN